MQNTTFLPGTFSYSVIINRGCPDSVSAEVSPAGNQSQLAFRDRQTTLEFIIERASPDVESEGIEWIFESDRLDLAIVVSTNNDSRYYFSENRRSLTIFNLTINDTGRYTIIATNPAGARSSFIDLDIQGELITACIQHILHFLLLLQYNICLISTAFPDLEITSSPQTVVTGETVELDCFAEGSPLQNVKWDFTDVFGDLRYTLEYIITDVAIRNGSMNITLHSSDVSLSSVEEQYTISPPDQSIETKLYGMLTITNITAFQAGQYNCTLTNIYNTDSYSVPVNVQCEFRVYFICNFPHNSIGAVYIVYTCM